MAHTFTRAELHELVWSQPMRDLAKNYDISDRGLAKACAAANIPVPTRGYWAKLHAGKSVSQVELPVRGLGQIDRVVVGQHRWQNYERESDEEILRSPIPPPPTFEPDMEVVRLQAEALVRRAPLPLRGSHGWHSQIEKLLKADEARARKQAESPFPSTWDGPIFTSVFEKRRMRILNALFTCLTRCGMTPHLSDKYGREIVVTVGDMGVPLDLDSVGAQKLRERERAGYGFVQRGDKDGMRLLMTRWWSQDPEPPAWEDKGASRLEEHLREIAAAIVVFAEQQVRLNAQREHESRIERKAQLEEAERKRLAAQERRRRERLARWEKARVDHLLGQAIALHQAQQIRAYVDAVRALNTTTADPMPTAELEDWSNWALAQADRIDPVLSGAFRTPAVEPEN